MSKQLTRHSFARYASLLVLTGSLLMLLSACSRKPGSQKEQVSYAIGAQFGKSLRNQNLDIDSKAIANGIADGLAGKKLELTDEEIQASMMHLNEERQKEMHQQAEKNKVESDGFLSKNKTAEGIKITSSGLQYKITKEGAGASPQGDEVVVVNYKGTLVNGTEFDSSYKRNQPAEFPLNGVIHGWTEGLKLMKKGGQATFYIPPELGYGDRPRQNIPANSTLIFEVELVDIKPPAKPNGMMPGMPPGHPSILPMGKKKK